VSETAVVGLGRAGLATVAALTAAGRRVVGVERDARTVATVGAGRAPFPEPGLDARLRAARRRGLLRTTADPREAARAGVVFVCVGTPPRGDGRLDASAVAAVLRAFARLPAPRGGRLLAVRSTLAPGTGAKALAPLLARARGTRLVLVPEFAREGSALADAVSAPRLVVGGRTPGEARAAARRLGLPGRVFACAWTDAELIKCADNAFHALKAAFANELTALARAFGADPDGTLAALRADARLNASAAYLFPGEAFGGPCLGKDSRALARAARAAGAAPVLLEGLTASNARRLDELAARAARGARTAAVLGLAFKRGTRDPRGSVAAAVAERLAARGLSVRVNAAELAPGARPPRGARALPSAAAAVRGAGVVVLGPGAGARERAAARGRRTVVLR
jgi:GDP-mannose 6-dehydrogenase